MRYISAKEYKNLAGIPRSRMSARFLLFAGVIIEKDGEILLTSNKKSKYPGWGLPGGKTLWSEVITDGAIREVKEETGYDIKLLNLVGVFQRETGPEDEEFLRVIFSGEINGEKGKILDPQIKENKWFSIKDILAKKVPLHSNQLLKEIERYNKGNTFPQEALGTYIW